MRRIIPVLICFLVAFSLSWSLFAQDQIAVFDIGPTTDLPEMQTAAADDIVRPSVLLELQPVDEPALPVLATSLQIARRLIAADKPPVSDDAPPPVWRLLLNNPPTAPPAA